jgi:hypothetical protein
MSYLCKLYNFRHKWIKYKNIIKLWLPKIQLLAVVPTQLKFSIVKDHDKPAILLFETLFCMWECYNMGTELPTKVILGQKLVLMQMTFLNNVRNVGRLVLSRTSCNFTMFCFVMRIRRLILSSKRIPHRNSVCSLYLSHPSYKSTLDSTTQTILGELCKSWSILSRTLPVPLLCSDIFLSALFSNICCYVHSSKKQHVSKQNNAINCTLGFLGTKILFSVINNKQQFVFIR